MDDRTTKKPRRSWLQFSVRALLLAVILIAVFLGVQVNRARTQARAVAAVKAYGGFVHYDYEYVSGAYKSGCEPWAPSWLRAAIGDDFFRTAVEVNLIYDGTGAAQVQTARTDDAVMPVLRDLPGLKTLCIHEGQATDLSGWKCSGISSSLENLSSIPRGDQPDRRRSRQSGRIKTSQRPVARSGQRHRRGARASLQALLSEEALHLARSR